MSAVPSATEIVFPWSPARVSAVGRISWKRKLHWALLTADTIVVAAVVIFTFRIALEPDARLQGVLAVPYAVLGVALTLGWVLLLAALGSRSTRVLGAGLEEYRRVLSASMWLFGVLAIASFVFQASVSRALFVTTLPLGMGLLLAERWSARYLLNRLRAQGRSMSRTLVVGTAPQVNDLLEDLTRRTDAGYRARGVCIIGPGELSPSADGQITRVRVEHLLSAASSRRYEAVMITDGLGRDEIRDLAWQLESQPIEMMFLPRLTDIAGPRLEVSDAEGLSLVHVDLPRFTGWKLRLKRGFDLVFAGLALVLLAPVFLVVAVLIKLDDGGPVLFRQERIGLRGRPFTIHKFRTMCVDAEAKIDALIAANGGTALLFKLEDDPRITPIGRILRKYSIDELPQFWSVLRGGMSVVGPRPQVAREVAEYTDVHHRRLLIKPGITGLWQVNGRSELSLEESIRLDLRYVENWSLLGDVTIILKTIGVVARPNGAF